MVGYHQRICTYFVVKRSVLWAVNFATKFMCTFFPQTSDESFDTNGEIGMQATARDLLSPGIGRNDSIIIDFSVHFSFSLQDCNFISTLFHTCGVKYNIFMYNAKTFNSTQCNRETRIHTHSITQHTAHKWFGAPTIIETRECRMAI